uniref:HvfC/BufC family peptide modification chaperone n=1 Tax=Marinobacterium profundum TaxID=1714300 RepID=UPI00082C0D5C|nr:putative DNA-binding domain-containing protein [Marinobacterium profundum]
MRLADLQAALQAEMEGEPSTELRQLVTSSSLAPEQCLQLYRDLQARAQTQALQQLYPVTARLLGPQLFAALSQQYSQSLTRPDNNGVYGDGFAELLEQCTERHDSLRHLQFLPELATLEWTLHLAWCAGDDPPLSFDSLIYIPESEQYRLRLVPSQALQLLHCSWPVLEIWHSHQHDNSTELHLSYRPQWLCVYRQLDSPQVESLTEVQASLLNGILRGDTLYQLGRAVPDINQHLSMLISRRWITHFKLPPDVTAADNSRKG